MLIISHFLCRRPFVYHDADTHHGRSERENKQTKKSEQFIQIVQQSEEAAAEILH